MKKALSNHEIVTLAVYLLGGESQHVDTEDIAVKANELAPGRLTWRRYPDQINLELVRVFLSDAKKPQNGAYLIGTGKKGWMLTEDGLAFAQKRVSDLDAKDLSRKALTHGEKSWRRNERVRMLSTDAFGKIQTGRSKEVTVQEAQAFFRIDDYVVGEAREAKIVRILNAFGDDPELAPVIEVLASIART